MKKTTEEKKTLIDVVSERFEKISRARDEENVKARQRLKELEGERAPILVKRDDLEKRISSMTAEYTALLKETAAAEEVRIKEGAIVEEDLKAGRVTAGDFLQFGKKAETVQAEARMVAEEKLGKISDAIRSLRSEAYETDVLIADLNEKIGFVFRGIAELFFFQLSSMRQELINAGVGSASALFLHQAVQEAHNEHAMVTKGFSLRGAKTWKITTVEEAELFNLDPVVQPGHFEKLREFIASDLKGKDFTEATVGYLPNDLPGRPAGFWLMSMKNLR